MAAWPQGERWLPQASHLDAVSTVPSGVGTGSEDLHSESPAHPSLSLLGPLVSGGPALSRGDHGSERQLRARQWSDGQ